MISRLAAFLLLVTASWPVWAQTAQWPERNVTFVCPYPAGGGTDLTVRAFADVISRSIRQPVVVENRVGAAGEAAANLVSKARPDGYTFLIATNSVLSLIPHVHKTLYDPLKDFVLVGRFADPVVVFAVKASLPVNSLKEFAEYAKARPGKVFYGATPVSVNRLLADYFQQREGFQMTHVGYKGDPDGLLALMANDIQLMEINLVSALPHLATGELKALAVFSGERIEDLPNVQATGELYPDFPAIAWLALAAPAGTPESIVNRMANELAKADNDPEIKARLKASGVRPHFVGPAETAAGLQRESEIYGKLVKSVGLKD